MIKMIETITKSIFYLKKAMQMTWLHMEFILISSQEPSTTAVLPTKVFADPRLLIQSIQVLQNLHHTFF